MGANLVLTTLCRFKLILAAILSISALSIQVSGAPFHKRDSRHFLQLSLTRDFFPLVELRRKALASIYKSQRQNCLPQNFKDLRYFLHVQIIYQLNDALIPSNPLSKMNSPVFPQMSILKGSDPRLIFLASQLTHYKYPGRRLILKLGNLEKMGWALD